MDFPKDFIWGTATSAHQTEGNNTNSDWWHWETTKPPRRQFPIESSGIACDSYHRYEEDFDLCVKLNNNAVRISIEWARIEPSEGKFSKEAILHYREVLKAAKARKLKTFVTLHHFTIPFWLSKKGGWHSKKVSYYFQRYAQKCARELGDLIDYFATINEPQVYALMGYVQGTWPPNKSNLFLSLIVQINFILAHRKAYYAIKEICNKPVGIVKNIVWYETNKEKSNFLDSVVVRFLYFLNADFFLGFIKKQLDYIGLNYYFTTHIVKFKRQNPDDFISDLGWWICPDGLEKILLDLKKYNLPIYVTENGLADSRDNLREKFIHSMLFSCYKAIEKNVPVKGYFYWSLIDNFEWHQGFWPKFGLVEIDRIHGLKRKPRKSFYYYANICARNKIE